MLLNLSISLYFLLEKQTKAKPNQSTLLLSVAINSEHVTYRVQQYIMFSRINREGSLTEAATCVALFKFLPCVLIQGDIHGQFSRLEVNCILGLNS